MSRFAYQKRAFLAPPATTGTSHILAEVESSRNGKNRFGDNLLTIADCRRSIKLEFFLGTKRSRKQSLRSLNLLIAILTRFRDALQQEIHLIEHQ